MNVLKHVFQTTGFKYVKRNILKTPFYTQHLVETHRTILKYVYRITVCKYVKQLV